MILNKSPQKSTSQGLVAHKFSRFLSSRSAFSLLLFFCVISYLINLSVNGFGNEYYAAAAQAGARSWKAFFYGTSDFPATITVDKPPLSLWLPSLFVRFFGLSSWSILLPSVIMMLISLILIYTQVKRHFGPLAAWISGFLFASTPLVFVMFRYNNPEALMILLMIAMAWAIDNAINSDTLGKAYRWLFISGVFGGCAFLTKQLEALMTLPALTITIIIFMPHSWKHKIIDLTIAGCGLILSAGWWIAIVELLPKDQRPYIGSTQSNDFLELTFDYNGPGRIGNLFDRFSTTVSHPSSGYSSEGFSGNIPSFTTSKPGFGRFFFSDASGQIGWLLGLAIVSIIIFLWLILRRKSSHNTYSIITSGQKAFYINWALSLITFFIIFSFTGKEYHPYYPVVMGSPLGILVGITLSYIWQYKTYSITRVIAIIDIIIAGIQYCANYSMENNYLHVMIWV